MDQPNTPPPPWMRPEWLQAWISDFAKQFPGVEGLQAELTRALDQCGKQWADRLQIVTREEWDVQSQVLVRTRQQIAALEKRVAALEAALAGAPDLRPHSEPPAAGNPLSQE